VAGGDVAKDPPRDDVVQLVSQGLELLGGNGGVGRGIGVGRGFGVGRIDGDGDEGLAAGAGEPEELVTRVRTEPVGHAVDVGVLQAVQELAAAEGLDAVGVELAGVVAGLEHERREPRGEPAEDGE
jgi:hypothetical protein